MILNKARRWIHHSITTSNLTPIHCSCSDKAVIHVYSLETSMGLVNLIQNRQAAWANFQESVLLESSTRMGDRPTTSIAATASDGYDTALEAGRTEWQLFSAGHKAPNLKSSHHPFKCSLDDTMLVRSGRTYLDSNGLLSASTRMELADSHASRTALLASYRKTRKEEINSLFISIRSFQEHHHEDESVKIHLSKRSTTSAFHCRRSDRYTSQRYFLTVCT